MYQVDSASGQIGFIGLGVMGQPMASNLRAASFPLICYSRSRGPVEELVSLGAEAAESPADVARQVNTVITMLPDTSDVESVLFGRDGVIETFQPGGLVIDMSSINPLATRRFAATLESRSVTLLDAPVSGGERGAIEGTLSIMVGGPASAFECALPILQALGKNIVHVGESGAGQIAKACNQLVVGATIGAVAEALVLAARAGVDPGRVRQALLGGFASSRVLEVHGQRMLHRDFDGGFRVRLHQKDAAIIVAIAHELGVPIRVFEPVADALDELVEYRKGELDHSALVMLVERAAGVNVGNRAEADST